MTSTTIKQTIKRANNRSIVLKFKDEIKNVLRNDTEFLFVESILKERFIESITMIYDPFIKGQISQIDNDLSEAVASFIVNPPDPSFPTSSSKNLNILQRQLDNIKDIIDKFQSKLEHKQDQGGIIKVDYKLITNISNELFNLKIPLNETERQIYNIILKYITIVCYYTLISHLLITLPQGNDTQSYYNSIIRSKSNQIIYMCQTSITKGFTLIKNLVINKKHDTSFFISQNWKPNMRKLFMIQNLQIVGIPQDLIQLNPLKMIKFIIWQQPFQLIKNELSHILRINNNEMHDYTVRLGQLIALQDNPTEITFNVLNTSKTSDKNQQLKTVIEEASMLQKENHMIVSCGKPNVLTRCWPLALSSLIVGPRFIRYCWDSRFQVQKFVQTNVIELSQDLVRNWIITPLKKIIATIRHDESTMIAMVSSNSLQSEQESLIRMIIEFLLDNNSNEMSPHLVDTLTEQIQRGQLDQFMNIYETQLTKPIKNTINGKLIRSLLIQVQKMKVDGSIALNGVDKMLKSQELLFGMIAISPSILLLYSMTQTIHRLIKWGNIWSQVKTLRWKLLNSLNNVERLLNLNLKLQDVDDNNDEYYYNTGLLIVEISNVYETGSKILPKRLKNQWRSDTLELLRSDFTANMKLNVINRIYHIYGNCFQEY